MFAILFGPKSSCFCLVSVLNACLAYLTVCSGGLNTCFVRPGVPPECLFAFGDSLDAVCVQPWCYHISSIFSFCCSLGSTEQPCEAWIGLAKHLATPRRALNSNMSKFSQMLAVAAGATGDGSDVAFQNLMASDLYRMRSHVQHRQGLEHTAARNKVVASRHHSWLEAGCLDPIGLDCKKTVQAATHLSNMVNPTHLEASHWLYVQFPISKRWFMLGLQGCMNELLIHVLIPLCMSI